MSSSMGASHVRKVEKVNKPDNIVAGVEEAGIGPYLELLPSEGVLG